METSNTNNTNSINTNRIIKEMELLVDDCRDPNTGEINYTLLAENACEELNAYEDDEDYTIPEEFFELALIFK